MPIFEANKYKACNMEVTRNDYDMVTDEDGAVFVLVEVGRKLVKAPNVSHYRIPESVQAVSPHAFQTCSRLKKLDVPYTINSYESNLIEEECGSKVEVTVWDWPYDPHISEELRREIADGWADEYGFVYSRDRKRLLRAAPKVTEYWIPEGVERIERLAFLECSFETIHVPYTCQLQNLDEGEWPVFGSERVAGCVTEWDRPYSEQDEIEDCRYCGDSDHKTDEQGVMFTRNGKRLLGATANFDEHAEEYTVPEGVVTVCDGAFCAHQEFLTLYVPRSVRVIGDHLFGEPGGKIVIP